MSTKKTVVEQKEEALYIIIDYNRGQNCYEICRGKDDLIGAIQRQFYDEYDSNFDRFSEWLDDDTEVLKIESGQVTNVRDDLSGSIKIETTIKINF